MVFWKDIVGIFNHRKNKQAQTVIMNEQRQKQQVNQSQTQPSTSSTVAEELELEEEEVPPTTPVVVNQSFLLPEVEFEESRNLLQLDFFGSSGQDQGIASFPKFDYLLEDNKKTQSIEKKPRKSSTLLRHKLSLYRPGQKTVKRSVSTPDIYNSK